MENASKALIIAGAILLSILIIGLGMFIYQQAAGAMEGVNMNAQEVQAYNSQFIQYEGQRNGSSVRALCDLVRNHNNSNANDASLQIGVVYGQKGLAKTESSIDTEITYAKVTEVKDAIKVGKTYNVAFTTAKSGKIIGITITDVTSQ